MLNGSIGAALHASEGVHRNTYGVTGWRVGHLLAPERLSTPIRRVHDFLTMGAAAPLQEAAAVALRFPASYYAELLAGYLERCALLGRDLAAAGFRVYRPAGATSCGRLSLPRRRQ